MVERKLLLLFDLLQEDPLGLPHAVDLLKRY